jgi:3-hydroxyisobutyrate dehydrogenase
MRIAIIGCGEVGRCYAAALAEAGHALELCDPKPGPAAETLAARLGVTIHGSADAWLGDCDAVLSAVVGSISLAVAEGAVAAMKRGALFADLTTADPEAIRRAAAFAQERGLSYADVAIMAPISLGGAKTPLLAAGDGAAKIQELLGGVGASVRVIEGGAAGDASQLKILRSAFMKGLEALAIEAFAAARQLGKVDALYEALTDMDRTPIRPFLETLIRTHLIHAPRRLHEIEEVEHQLRAAGLDLAVLPGVRRLFERSCSAMRAKPPGRAGENADAALDWLLETVRQTDG